jgi:hypothetical protein
MSSKKKKQATKVVEPVVEQPIDPTPTEDVPTIQLDEVLVEEKTDSQPVVETAPTVEPVAETASIIEAVVHEAEPEKSADVVPPPVVEHKTESMHTLPPKPKTLTLAYLQEECGVLMEIIELHSTLITELQETQARKRKPPISNGKVEILDTLTGRTFPSKNNAYQTMLKAGELNDLVKKGLFGDNPYKNSFGCYNLFRAFPGRFVGVKPEETNVL